jgi:hypothetical protein
MSGAHTGDIPIIEGRVMYRYLGLNEMCVIDYVGVRLYRSVVGKVGATID